MSKKFKLPSIRQITIENIINFVEGNFNYLRAKSAFLKLPKHIQEQATYRASLCKPCLEIGSCMKCHCQTPQMFYSPKKIDKDEKWSIMLGEYEWAQFKLDNNIDIEALEKEYDLASLEVNREYDKETINELPNIELNNIINQLDLYVAEDITLLDNIKPSVDNKAE